MTNLPVLVIPGEGQSGCTVLGSENRPNYGSPGPHSTLMESVSDSLVRNLHASGPLEVSLKGPGRASPGPPRRQTEKSVLLLGGGPSSALPGSPGVLASLLKASPRTGDHTGRHPKPSGHLTYRRTILNELDCLCDFARLEMTHTDSKRMKMIREVKKCKAKTIR